MSVKRRKRALVRPVVLGAELLSLCETFTASGRLTPQDVEALRTWLKDAAWTELPQHLRNVVSRVIVARQLTRDEYRDIYLAVEAMQNPSTVQTSRLTERQARRSWAPAVVFAGLICLATLAAILTGQ